MLFLLNMITIYEKQLGNIQVHQNFIQCLICFSLLQNLFFFIDEYFLFSKFSFLFFIPSSHFHSHSLHYLFPSVVHPTFFVWPVIRIYFTFISFRWVNLPYFFSNISKISIILLDPPKNEGRVNAWKRLWKKFF